MYTLVMMAATKPHPYVYRYKDVETAQQSVYRTVSQSDRGKSPVPMFEPIDGLKDSYTFEYRGFRAWLFADKDLPPQLHPTILIEIDDPDDKELT